VKFTHSAFCRKAPKQFFKGYLFKGYYCEAAFLYSLTLMQAGNKLPDISIVSIEVMAQMNRKIKNWEVQPIARFLL